jgi:hypothetical protein
MVRQIMTMTLWLDTDAEQTIELGGTLEAYAAFAEMARAVDETYDEYADLFGVPEQCANQDDADPEWLEDVKRQAQAMLDGYRDKLGANAVDILEQLAADTPTGDDLSVGKVIDAPVQDRKPEDDAMMATDEPETKADK